MLSKEEVLEIISYCDSHKINRSDRLQELGISPWNFYKSRRHHLKAEKSSLQDSMGPFIQLTICPKSFISRSLNKILRAYLAKMGVSLLFTDRNVYEKI